MKKIFTLIAAAMLAVGAYAQTTYELSGLSYDDLQYADSVYSYNSKNGCLDFNKTDNTWYNIEVKGKPITFAYKSSKKKAKIFYVKDTYLQTGGKGVRLIISGLTSGQEFEIEVASKGGTAAVFEPVDGCTAAEGNPTLEGKEDGQPLAYVTLKYTATAETATIVENANGFAIDKVTIAAKPEQPVTPDEPATGIKTVKTDKVNADAPLYNVAGQRVSKNYKGIVIQDGKKFVNK